MPKISRRTFLWMTGGTGLALATDPPRKLVNKLIPQVIPPEHIKPGEWVFFPTTCRECPAGCGMHLWHRDGRVTKAEGNPLHPVNRGGLCPRGQSSLQGLYDPDRLNEVTFRPRGGEKKPSSWETAMETIAARLAAGGKPALVSSLQTGALAEVMQRFSGAFRADRLLLYEPFNYEALKKAHLEVFGQPVIPDYRIDRCEFVISFAADFLETWVSPVSYAAQFGDMHSWHGTGTMNRMAYVGPRLSMTAANADHFIQVPPGYERLVAVAMLKEIMDRGWAKRDVSSIKPLIGRIAAATGHIPGVSQEAIVRLARWFTRSRGSLALAGPTGMAGPYAIETAISAALLNYAAGRIGETVDFSRPHALGNTAGEADIQSFLSSLGSDDVLFIHDTNLLYSRPSAAGLISRAGMTVYLGTLPDETAEAADWVLPIDSPLESWGDYEPAAGIHSLMQPTMGRITDSRPAGDIFLSLAQQAGKKISRSGVSSEAGFQGWLAGRWEDLRRTVAPGTAHDEFWTTALRNGGFWEKGGKNAPTALKATAAGLLTGPPPALEPEAAKVELWPWASIMLFDGRTSNRGWIQEAPDPLTFITWGNWLDLHPKKAAALKLRQGDVAELSTEAGTVRVPVRITDEISENVAAMSFGQGHVAMGKHARGIGANVFKLLGAPQPSGLFPVCSIRKVSAQQMFDPTYTAPTRQQFDRQIVQWVPLSQLRMIKAGEAGELDLPLAEGYKKDTDFYPKREYLSHRWSMVVDLQRCIGCGACGVACYAENNIAVIGKMQVAQQREMAWLRVAPYRKPGASSMRYSWLPLLCQHCDQAPCEPVCPVYAAVHNEEGLNAQIYNRCIGTRYCNNNCPYKVRRFNWLNVEWRKPLDVQLNPEVTVRCRGVMEKCTFCIQRIRNAEYRAFREDRKVRDGEIQPACAQSCPTKVYTFGDLLDPESKVSRLIRTDPRRYQVLQELNTKPAVIYLRRVDNDME